MQRNKRDFVKSPKISEKNEKKHKPVLNRLVLMDKKLLPLLFLFSHRITERAELSPKLEIFAVREGDEPRAVEVKLLNCRSKGLRQSSVRYICPSPGREAVLETILPLSQHNTILC